MISQQPHRNNGALSQFYFPCHATMLLITTYRTFGPLSVPLLSIPRFTSSFVKSPGSSI